MSSSVCMLALESARLKEEPLTDLSVETAEAPTVMNSITAIVDFDLQPLFHQIGNTAARINELPEIPPAQSISDAEEILREWLYQEDRLGDMLQDFEQPRIETILIVLMNRAHKTPKTFAMTAAAPKGEGVILKMDSGILVLWREPTDDPPLDDDDTGYYMESFLESLSPIVPPALGSYGDLPIVIAS